MLSTLHKDSWLLKKRLGHTRMSLLSKLIKNNLVCGFPIIKYENDKVCYACQIGKQVKYSFQSKNVLHL